MRFPRRPFLSLLLLLLLASSLLQAWQRSPAAARPAARGYLVFVGTYTRDGSKGIYAYRYNPPNGDLKSLGLVAETANPSFLAVHPSHRFLYAANEINNYQGQKSGAISAFAIQPKTGRLTLLNQVPSRGADPAYISIDKTGRWLFVANYSGGSVAVLSIGKDGRLGPIAEPAPASPARPKGTSAAAARATASAPNSGTRFIQHTGSSVNRDRQLAPHAHSIDLSPDGRHVIVADLGLDQLKLYRFDAIRGLLSPNQPPSFKTDPGAGPRHFAFAPGGRFAYAVTELHPDVIAFSYDPATGNLHPLQTISTLPPGFTAPDFPAEIAVHPSGKFLYVSNRGHNSIAVFAIDHVKGTLTPLEFVPTSGKKPRNFAIDPTGSRLFVANQDSADIVTFRIDPATGRLTATGQVVLVSNPVDIVFVPE